MGATSEVVEGPALWTTSGSGYSTRLLSRMTLVTSTVSALATRAATTGSRSVIARSIAPEPPTARTTTSSVKLRGSRSAPTLFRASRRRVGLVAMAATVSAVTGASAAPPETRMRIEA